MMLLSTAHPSWMLLYAFMATAARRSVAGFFISFRDVQARGVAQVLGSKTEARKNLIERYDAMAVLVATLCRRRFRSSCSW